MTTLLHFHIKLCRCKLLGNPCLDHLLKKSVYFTFSVANYVNKSDPKTTTVHVTGDGVKIFPIKPQIVPAWRPTPSTDYTNIVHHYLKLSKIRLTCAYKLPFIDMMDDSVWIIIVALVAVTNMAGYALAPAPFEWNTFTLCIIGTGLLSAAANTVNQFHEVPFDAQMSRTKHRVLVCGRLSPIHAMLFAITTSLSGLSILNYGVNGLTAGLGLVNFILYTSIYTPMKRISILNTWIGSIVGAIPPLMGWAACANSLGPGAWLMAALLYSWQFPHFNALSWNLRPDYSRAGYRMMAVTDPGLCRRVALRHTIVIQALTVAAPYLDVTNWYFPLEASPLNLYFIYLAYNFYKDTSSQTSRKLFRFSLIHLPLLMVLLLVNKKKWFVFDDRTNVNSLKEQGDGSVT